MTSSRSRKPRKPAEPEIVVETLEWEGILIEVAYEADWLNSSEGHFPTLHLAITALRPERAPLPFTETGYRSHFVQPGTVEQFGGPAEFVRAWLEDAAKDKNWRRAAQARRQLDLFQ